MNRRKFMATASVVVLAAIVPAPQLTSATPEAITGSVLDTVFRIMEEYRFWKLDEQAGLFSYRPKTFADFNDLHKTIHQHAVEWNGRDYLDRMDFILTIREKLTERFGDDLQAHNAWLDTPHPVFKDRTPRDMMSTLHYLDIQRVVHFLENKTYSTA